MLDHCKPKLFRALNFRFLCYILDLHTLVTQTFTNIQQYHLLGLVKVEHKTFSKITVFKKLYKIYYLENY